MTRAEHTVDIARPVEEVFDYVTDQSNEPKWHTDVMDVDPAQRPELGDKMTWVVKFMGENPGIPCQVPHSEVPISRIRLAVRYGLCSGDIGSPEQRLQCDANLRESLGAALFPIDDTCGSGYDRAALSELPGR